MLFFQFMEVLNNLPRAFDLRDCPGPSRSWHHARVRFRVRARTAISSPPEPRPNRNCKPALSQVRSPNPNRTHTKKLPPPEFIKPSNSQVSPFPNTISKDSTFPQPQSLLTMKFQLSLLSALCFSYLAASHPILPFPFPDLTPAVNKPNGTSPLPSPLHHTH